MAENSAISWTDHTFNPWWGCTKVSQGCKNCYADREATRYGHSVFGPKASRRFFGDKHWEQPFKWQRDAEREGKRLRVFCASMSDVFEGPETCTEEDAERQDRARLKLFCEVIPKTPNLDWLILTKRPENVCKMLNLNGPEDWLIDNIWIGTSCEDEHVLYRVDELRKIPARIRFLSLEPLIGPIGNLDLRGIHWVIVGGESGPAARPMHPDWARSLRDQCQDAKVAFHFKQWGEWLPGHHFTDELRELDPNPEASRFECAERDGDGFSTGFMLAQDITDPDAMFKVGKRRAGRLLDGREWNEWPDTEAMAYRMVVK